MVLIYGFLLYIKPVNFGSDKFTFVLAIKEVVGKFFCSVFKYVIV